MLVTRVVDKTSKTTKDVSLFYTVLVLTFNQVRP